MTSESGLTQQRLVVVFVDICQSTRLYELHGDTLARERLRGMLAAIAGNAEQSGGRVVKEIGDASLLAFEQASDAIAFSRRLADVSVAGGLQCKTGMHLGEVILERGDLFGDTVNTAARIESQAAPGQVLLSAPVLQVLPAGERPEVRVVPAAAARGKRLMPELFELLEDGSDCTQVVDEARIQELRQALGSRLRLRWQEQHLELRAGCEDVSFGRGGLNQVSLDLARVSRTHLRLESRGSQWLVHDQSTNGTLLCVDGAAPVMLRREQHLLQASGVLELAPSAQGGAALRIHYEVLEDSPG